MSRTVVNEPSGTVSPLALRTRMLQHVLGVEPDGASRLRGDAEGAAEQVEVVDVGGAEIDLQRANTSATLMPSICALVRSMSR